MSETIGIELMFFLVSIRSGGFLLFAYDLIRIFRRIIKHNRFCVAIEDLLFWIVASIYLFGIMYEQNNGIIRGFSVFGMGLGMLLYYNIISKGIINIGTFLLLKAIAIIRYPFHLILKPYRKLIRLLKKIYRKVLKRLKKTLKTVKISITRH